MLKWWREYSFLLCLGISMIIVLVMGNGNLPAVNRDKEGQSSVFLQEETTFWEKAQQVDLAENLKVLKENILRTLAKADVDNSFLKESAGVSEEEKKGELLWEQKEEKEEIIEEKINIKENEIEETAVIEQEEEKKKEEPTIFGSDSTYFQDALFLGDSRTEGLREYGDLGEAVVLANSGMSVYRLWKESFLVNGEKQTLEEVLNSNKFGKVYFMLGVNELGYDYEKTMERFRETLTKIAESRPHAFIFLQANLHVTDEKGKHSDIYNNDNINKMNQGLKELAEEKGYFYLDVNPLFDDEKGNLSKEYTVDQAHILGKYYGDWVNWILQYCVK